MRSYRKVSLIILVLCVGFIIYSNVLGGSFQFDDYGSIVDNPSIRKLSELKSIWNFWPTRFVTYLSFALNYRLERLNVFYYHLFNLLIHLCSASLVWWLAILTFSTPILKEKDIGRYSDLIAFFAALIFVTHPIQTQGVTYIAQRATILAALFYLLSLCLYAKAKLSQRKKRGFDIPQLYYYGSIMAAVTAMFTKEMAISLPFMIFLYDFSFLKSEKGVDWKRLTPFFILIAVIPFTMFATRSVNFLEMRRLQEGAPSIPQVHYLLTQFRVMTTYMRLLFIPINQNVDYDYRVSKTLMEFPAMASFILLIFILIASAGMFSKYRPLSFGVFWFFLSLLPESSIIPIEDVIFEHRLYLPMAGFSLFLTSAAYYLLGRKSVKVIAAVLITMSASFSILTYNRNSVWKDELGLWNDTVSKSPNKARPYNNRGGAYSGKGELENAIRDFNKAIQLDPRGDGGYYYNRANAYSRIGDTDKAIADYTEAINLKAVFADVANAHINRGNAYYKKGNIVKAISDYSEAIRLKPTYVIAYNNRAGAYYKIGELDKAVDDYTTAIGINSNLYLLYKNRAEVYLKKKEYEKYSEDVHRMETLKFKP